MKYEISWFVGSKRYIIVSRWIQELSKYVPGNVSAWSFSLFFHTTISIESWFNIDKSKIRSFNWYRLMVEKGVRGGTCLCIYRYGKANSKYIKDYDKNKVPSYLQY